MLSCGCIIFKDEKVLIIKQLNGDYGFPKGHIEDGETEVECAYRETLEETGVRTSIDSKYSFSISYKVQNGFMKKVVYFIAIPKNYSIKVQESELECVMWVDIDEVYDILTHDNLKKMWLDVYSTYKEVYCG